MESISYVGEILDEIISIKDEVREIDDRIASGEYFYSQEDIDELTTGFEDRVRRVDAFIRDM